MLRIAQSNGTGQSTQLHLEGQLSGPWVLEMEFACENLLNAGKQLALDLGKVTYVDQDGLALLTRLCARHVRLDACSPFVREQLKAVNAPCRPTG